MNLFGLEIGWSRKSAGDIPLNTLLSRLDALTELASGISVTPENCMQSPTVNAVVQAVSRRIATLPVQVLQKGTTNGKPSKQPLPDHPLAKLLEKPAAWLTGTSYWLDATSWLVRYGNFYSWKGQGRSGPVRELIPLHPGCVSIYQEPTTWAVTYRVTAKGVYQEYQPTQIHHARGPARDGVCGDSPVRDVAEAIALEIAAEKFGAALFGNGATPGLVLQNAPGTLGFKTDEERAKFRQNIEEVYGKRGRHRVLLLPKGIEIGQQVPIENEKAQFLATRQYQRTVIAGAFGVPPHLVGDLSKGTFNNTEQQNLSFITNVVLPIVRIFESAMERDLLTEEDRASGIIIRFNIDAALRASFKERQDGLNVMRNAGVLSPNEWREIENMNPISDEDGGDTYWQKGPSGQGADDDGGEREEEDESADEEEEGAAND
jgi:HK97 family phage portal protein